MSAQTSHADGPELVVIGASAGGVDALSDVFRQLAPDFPAGLLVVLHLAASSPSLLPHILSRVCSIPVIAAEDGQAIEPGHAYVARPDLHLVVEDGHMRLQPTARVNGHRPAIDPLFCSAAEAYGPRVAAVILSGTRDDGTIGMARIKHLGGRCIVQDPRDALHDGMPRSAIEHVQVDAVLAADAIGPALNELVSIGSVPTGAATPTSPSEMAADDPLTTVCPECGGVLTEHIDPEGVMRFACHVGHEYAPQTLAELQGATVEQALWTAVRTLSDRQALLERLAEQAEARDQQHSARNWRRQARVSLDQADHVRHAIAALARSAAITGPAEPVAQEIGE